METILLVSFWVAAFGVLVNLVSLSILDYPYKRERKRWHDCIGVASGIAWCIWIAWTIWR